MNQLATATYEHLASLELLIELGGDGTPLSPPVDPVELASYDQALERFRHTANELRTVLDNDEHGAKFTRRFPK